MVSGVGKDAPHRDFAKRLEQAIDAMGNEVPPPNFGRLRWFREQVGRVTGEVPAAETVRKWLAGLVIPRKEALDALAEILKVDTAWLMFGSQSEVSETERRVRNAEANGAVNVLCGVIQMDGGHPAFPEAGEETDADLFAIIRGARYSFKVAVGEPVEGGGYRFSVPMKSDNLLLIGVVRTAPHNFAFYELDMEATRQEGRRGVGAVSVVADLSDLRRIENFGQRL